VSAVAHTQLVERRLIGVDALLLRARSNLIGNPRQAFSAANEAVALADSSSDPESQAAARHLRGEAHRILGQHEAALRDYAEASRGYRRLGRPGDAARSDASAVDSLRCLGRSTQALRLAVSARGYSASSVRSSALLFSMRWSAWSISSRTTTPARCDSSIALARWSPRSVGHSTSPR